MRLLLVVLDDFGVPQLRLGGILSGVPAGPALSEEVPALVQLHLELLEAGSVLVGKLRRGVSSLELVLLGDETVDLFHDLAVVHGSPIVVSDLHRLGAVPLVTLAIPEASA